MTVAALRPVAIEDLPEYPLAALARLDGNSFTKWHHARWLASTSFRKMGWEAQGMARALFDMAQMETPVGTLPADDEELAIMLRIEPRRLRELRAQEFGPLRHWVPCRCGEQVRLMHPVVLEQVQDALERRETRALSNEQKAVYQRRKRLVAALEEMGVDKALCADEWFIERLDDWIGKRRRGAAVYAQAMMHAQGQGWARQAGLRASGRG